jgi:hypothetical protein
MALLSAPMSSQGNASAAALASDETQIYSTTIRAVFRKWKWDDKPITLLVIEDHTRTNSYDGPDIANADIRAVLRVPDELLSDFRAKNRSPSAVQMTLDLPVPVKSLESSRIQGQFPAGGWWQFSQDYPGSPGFLSVSSIGFNSAHDRALVYVAHAYSVDGGQGHVFLLKKRGSEWRIEKQEIVWVWVG